MESASMTRRSSRERVQTPKALEWNQGRSRTVSSDGEDSIEVIEEAPAAPRSKRTEDFAASGIRRVFSPCLVASS